MSRYRSLMGWRVSRFIFAVLLLTLASAGAAHANSFQVGQFVTYPQSLWGGSVTNPGAILLFTDYGSVYAGTGGVLTVGLPNMGFTLSFDASSAVFAYLPSSGSPAPLNTNYLDPSTTSAGAFGGHVVALQLNVDFNNAGFLQGTSSTLFGNLVLQNMVNANLDGLTVSQFLADANTCLGGGVCVDSLASLDAVASALDFGFNGGTVNPFADTNLVLPTSATVPEPSSLLLVATGLLGLGWTRRFKRAR